MTKTNHRKGPGRWRPGSAKDEETVPLATPEDTSDLRRPRVVRFQDGTTIWSRSSQPWVMEPNPGDVEAPKDPGAMQTHQSYTEQDYEGHRAHTMYVGVHLPGHRRRSHRRHHHHRHHHKKDDDDSDRPVTPPAQRVQFILGEDAADADGLHESHPLFSEMEELVLDGGEMEWKETARWIKFEEDVEEGGNRWSKPHVATLSLHSLFELRSMLLNNTVMLDMDASSLDQIADLVLDNMISSGQLAAESRDKIREALLRRHRHLHERRKDNSSSNMSRLPIIRSLAEIGRNHSSSKSVPSVPDGMEHSHSGASIHRVESGTGLAEQNGDTGHQKGNTHFMRKIPPGAEASNILVGEVDFLEKPLSAFIRLAHATPLGDLTEVPVPTRFIYILLGPLGGISRYHEIGRAMATLMSDEVFHDVAYKGKHRQHLLAGVDEFLDAVTVLPPGEWDPSIRIEPPAAIPSQDPRKHPGGSSKEESHEEEDEEKLRAMSGLTRTGRWFGGLINDLKRKKPWYWSDFKDACSSQCIASYIFLYFACLTPIITFGGLLGEATKQNMAAIESLVSGFVCGIGYGFFSGQPLTLLGSTGPVLVFETIVYDFCHGQEWDYMSFRLWIGLWMGLILLILVALDASAFVCYITRFTEENFATLIAFIFIYKAVEKVALIGTKHPFNVNADIEFYSSCSCIPTENSTVDDNFNWTEVRRMNCPMYNGTLEGVGCQYESDVFLMSVLLFMGTFSISIILKDFKNSSFFPTKMRGFISDFSVIIAILSMSILDMCMAINTPKLQVPETLTPTDPTKRSWLIPLFGKDGINPWWTPLIAPVPALLATILIFMDQQITAVIINRKEHKLKKGCGYHLDLFVLSILIVICSIMGLPWFVAATVLSINHVNSLRMESECAAPGEKPQFLGVREQRVTHIMIFLTIGLSVLLTPVLKHIPMPVLFGVFLYMGIASLKGLQFFDRILIMLMPAKYQPDFMFLRQVPLKRVHFYTIIQLTCLILLWVIKSFKQTSILFPLMLVVMIGLRKVLDFIFTQRDLKILDDIMPETTKRSKAESTLKDPTDDILGFPENPSDPSDSTGNMKIPLANGTVMNIPMASINISEEVNKSGVWHQVNTGNKESKEKEKDKDKEKKHSSSKSRKRGSKKDAVSDDEKKRLSTMAEEEEDDGLIIKIVGDTTSETIDADVKKKDGVNSAETSV